MPIETKCWKCKGCGRGFWTEGAAIKHEKMHGSIKDLEIVYAKIFDLETDGCPSIIEVKVSDKIYAYMQYGKPSEI